MKTYWLKEDKRLTKLPVVFSPEISQSIDNVYRRNYDSQEALTEWKNYIDGIIGYISNPVIAWDYVGRYPHFPNGAIYVSDFGYNAAFIVKTNFKANQPYVYLFKLNLNLEAFGLKTPPLKEENLISVTKSDFKNMVLESVGKILLTEKYYNPAIEPMIDYKIGNYDVLYGAEEEQIICDLPQKGWVEDIIMYSAMPKGKTYALYRRCDNGKYFFVEIMSVPEDKKYLHAKVISRKSVPQIIWNDAKDVVCHNQILRGI